MIEIKICEWLIDNADTPIRYRVLRELLHDDIAAQKIESELLENITVQKWLKLLKPETPPQHRSMEHGCFDFCLENALPKIVQLGLHGRMPPVIDAVDLYVNRLKDAYANENYPDKYTLRLTENLLSFAYFNDDIVLKMMLDGLERIFHFTKQGIYDLYLSEEEQSTLIKVPSVWKDSKGFIKPEIYRTYGFSYPLIYDIVGMSSLYTLNNPEIDAKINNVIDYISNDEFHDKIFDGYGILVEENNKYHGMGWDPKYPGWQNPTEYIERNRGGVPKLLFFTQNIIKYPKARKTKWFSELLAYLEQYQTDEGHYIFPSEWLKGSPGYAVQGHHLSFGENRRKKNWNEIESTFFMQMLYQYM